jgi:hypothetical protein
MSLDKLVMATSQLASLPLEEKLKVIEENLNILEEEIKKKKKTK